MSMTQDKNAGFACQPVSGGQTVSGELGFTPPRRPYPLLIGGAFLPRIVVKRNRDWKGMGIRGDAYPL